MKKKNILLIALAFIFVVLLVVVSLPSKQVAVDALSVQSSLNGADRLNFEGKYVAKAEFNVTLSRGATAEYQVKVIPFSVPSSVSLVNYQRVEGNSYKDFADSLKPKLESAGLKVEESGVDFLSSRGKQITIVATGALPAALARDDAINRMLEAGQVVVYIGLPFNVVLNPDGSLSKDENNTASNAMGLSFSESSNGYSVSLAQGSGDSEFYKTDDGFYVLRKGAGYLVIYPGTLDRSFVSGSDAAEKVNSLIMTAGWARVLAEGSKEVRESGVVDIYTSSFSEKSGSVFAVVNATNGKEISNTIIFSKDLKVFSSSLSHESRLRGNSSLLITAAINEDKNFVSREVYKLNVIQKGVVVKSFDFGEANVKDFATVTYSLTGGLDTGDYTLALVDGSGRIKAESFLIVPKLRAVVRASSSITNGYSVDVFENDAPIKGVKLKVLTGGSEIPLETDFGGSASFKSKEVPAAVVIGGETLATDFVKSSDGLFDSDFNKFLIVLTVLILIVGVFVNNTPPEKFFIDVPDFAPMEREKVVVSKEDVLAAFDNANRQFKWSFMPLTAVELGNALKFGEVIPKGVALTQDNLEALLEKLGVQKLVSRDGEFFAPERWNSESGRSIHYLTLFRRVRNALINGALMFSDLNKSEDCDLEVTTRRGVVHLHLFEDYRRNGGLQGALKTCRDKRTVLVFGSNSERIHFEKELARSTKEVDLRVKLEVHNGKIVLSSVDELIEKL